MIKMINCEVLMYVDQIKKLLSLRAERRRREARRETFTTPEMVTTRRSILGPPAEGRPGPSIGNSHKQRQK